MVAAHFDALADGRTRSLLRPFGRRWCTRGAGSERVEVVGDGQAVEVGLVVEELRELLGALLRELVHPPIVVEGLRELMGALLQELVYPPIVAEGLQEVLGDLLQEHVCRLLLSCRLIRHLLLQLALRQLQLVALVALGRRGAVFEEACGGRQGAVAEGASTLCLRLRLGLLAFLRRHGHRCVQMQRRWRGLQHVQSEPANRPSWILVA